MSNVAELISAVASLIAVGIAWAAWRVALRTFHRDHRPVIRVVALAESPSAFNPLAGGIIAGGPITLNAILLKNIGRGPGLTVIAFDGRNALVLGHVDAVEPLGAGEAERQRLGRVEMHLQQPMEVQQTYELYYQDLHGRWHLTRFHPVYYQRIECSFAGTISDRKVPQAVKALGTITEP